MIRIVLTEEQMQAIADANEPVDFVDPSGRPLGRLARERAGGDGDTELTSEELAEIKRRMAGATKGEATFYSWNEVKSRLEANEQS